MTTLRVRMLLQRVDLDEVSPNMFQIPIPTKETIGMLQITDVPRTLKHECLDEYLTNLHLMSRWRTSKEKSNATIMIGQMPLYYRSPERTRRHTCADCKRPADMFYLMMTWEEWVEEDLIDRYLLCPADHLRRTWRDEARQVDPKAVEIWRNHHKGWADKLERRVHQYVQEQEAAFLARWTSRDSAWWRAELKKSAEASESSMSEN